MTDHRADPRLQRRRLPLRSLRVAWVLVRAVAVVALVAGLVRVLPRHGLVATVVYLAAVSLLIVILVIVVAGLVWLLRWMRRTARRLVKWIAEVPAARSGDTIYGRVVSVHRDYGSVYSANSSAIVELPGRTVIVHGERAASLQEGAGVFVRYDRKTGRAKVPAKGMSIGEAIGGAIIAPLLIVYVLATILGCVLLPMVGLGYAFWFALRIVVLALG